MSALDRNGLGDWLADRLVELGDTVTDDFPLRIDVNKDPVPRRRLRVANLPEGRRRDGDEPGRREKEVKIALFRKAGEKAGRGGHLESSSGRTT